MCRVRGRPSTLRRRYSKTQLYFYSWADVHRAGRQKGSSNQRDLKTPVFHFHMEGKSFENDTIMRIMWFPWPGFFSNINSNWPMMVAFLNSYEVAFSAWNRSVQEEDTTTTMCCQAEETSSSGCCRISSQTASGQQDRRRDEYVLVWTSPFVCWSGIHGVLTYISSVRSRIFSLLACADGRSLLWLTAGLGGGENARRLLFLKGKK